MKKLSRFTNITFLRVLFYILIILLLNHQNISSNEKLDSVLSLISDINNDTANVKHYLNAGILIKGSNPDSAISLFKQATLVSNSYPKNRHIKELEAETYIQIASIHQYRGLNDLALKYNSKADSICHRFNIENKQSKVENLKGLIAFNKGDYGSALNYYQQALEKAEVYQDRLFIAKIYSNMAIIRFYQGDYEEATDLFKMPVQIGKELKNDELLSGSLLNVSQVYFHLGQLDSSLSYLYQSLEMYKQMDGTDGQIICYKNIANIHLKTGKYDLAIETYTHSLELAEQLNDLPNQAKSLHNLGEVYASIGDYEQSQKYYFNALDLKYKVGDKISIAKSYKGIGSLHFQHNKYALALEYYEKANNIFIQENIKAEIAGVFSDMASVFTQQDSLLKAKAYLEKAYKTYEEIGNQFDASNALLNLSILFLKKSETVKAEKYILKAIELKNALHDEEGLIKSNHQLSMIKLQQNKLEDAKRIALYAWDDALATDNKALMLPIALNLSNILEVIGDSNGALKFFKIHSNLKDSIYTTESAKAMANAETRWHIKENLLRIDNLEREKELSELKLAKAQAINKHQNMVTSAIIIILTLLVLLIILLISYNTRKRKLLYQKQITNITKLKMQNIQNRISPHFFFNALTSASLPLNEFPEHKKSFDNLVLLLRRSLENAEKNIVTLSTEMEIVDAYLHLQKNKLGSDFKLKKRIEISDINKVHIPAMILQIPIENAIKHGLALKEGEKHLNLECKHENNGTLLLIDDNGIGIRNSSARSSGTGTGLRTLYQIIDILNMENENKITFSIQEKSNGNLVNPGTQVRIFIPDSFNYKLN